MTSLLFYRLNSSQEKIVGKDYEMICSACQVVCSDRDLGNVRPAFLSDRLSQGVIDDDLYLLIRFAQYNDAFFRKRVGVQEGKCSICRVKIMTIPVYTVDHSKAV